MKPPKKPERQTHSKKPQTIPPAPPSNYGAVTTFDALFPTLTPDGRETLLRLQAHAAEIQQWFREDPSRVQALQAKPHEALSDLSRALGFTLPVAAASEFPKITVLYNPLDCSCSPPALLRAVWEYIGQSDANLSAWSANPYQVIQQVASSTKASAQDEDAVLNAFEFVLNAKYAIPNLQALVQNVQSIKPSQLIIRPSQVK